MVDEVLEILRRFSQVPEFLRIMGWTFAVGMLMGAVLYQNLHSALRWILGGAVFLIFEEWARHAYLIWVFGFVSIAPLVLAFLVFTVYSGGAAFGAWLVHRAGQPYRAKREKLNARYKEIEAARAADNHHA